MITEPVSIGNENNRPLTIICLEELAGVRHHPKTKRVVPRRIVKGLRLDRQSSQAASHRLRHHRDGLRRRRDPRPSIGWEVGTAIRGKSSCRWRGRETLWYWIRGAR